jgi:integrase
MRAHWASQQKAADKILSEKRRRLDCRGCRLLGEGYADPGDRGLLVFARQMAAFSSSLTSGGSSTASSARARLPRVRFHDLRHGAASLRLAQGDSPRLVQELLGHASAVFTLQAYTHPLPGMRGQSAERLAQRLLGSQMPPGEG